jgi:sulfide:quinone oxidoreductase
VWSLPAYELALLTATHLARHNVRGVELMIVTPENAPLQLFGPKASAAVGTLLAERGISVEAGAYPKEVRDGVLGLLPEGGIAAERFVALPRLCGAPIDGLPQTVNRFVPVDAHCRVHGLDDVFAAGDITSFTVKQGGIATQQADVAAQAIAAAAGGDVTPERFPPDPPRAPADGTRAAIPPSRVEGAARTRARGGDRAALVAAGQDRGEIPGAVPRDHRSCRDAAGLSARGP